MASGVMKICEHCAGMGGNLSSAGKLRVIACEPCAGSGTLPPPANPASIPIHALKKRKAPKAKGQGIAR